jgi:hypothetical protein
MVTVPVRSAVVNKTVYVTVPLPEPDAPPVIVIQLALLDAVHAHPDADAVTATDPLPPAASNSLAVGEIE